MSTPPYPQARANPMQRRTVGSVWWSSASEPLRITQPSRGLSESHTRTSRYRHVRHGLNTAHDSRKPVGRCSCWVSATILCPWLVSRFMSLMLRRPGTLE